MVICATPGIIMEGSYIVLNMNADQPVLIPNNISSYITNFPFEENCDHKLMPNVKVLTGNNCVNKNDNSPDLDKDASRPSIVVEAADTASGHIKFECPSCKDGFDDILRYQEHKKIHEKNPFQCSKCNKSFNKLGFYNRHLLTHQDDTTFKCVICSASFNIENNYKVHMALHVNSLVCPICDLSFQRKASLKSHLAIHQVEELYKCPECASEFETTVDLSKHIRIHKIEDKNIDHKLICKYCKKQFDTKTKLQQHITGHLKIKKLVVNGKKSKKVESSTQGNKHRCNVCDKSFPKYSLLQRHVRIHNGEKPFVCSVCSKAFTQKVSLQIHLLKHTGIKPFCCTLCPASFYQKCNLKVHVEKTHSAKDEAEKIFKCSECDCIFKRLASLNAHMRKTHADCDLINITAVIHQLKDLEMQLDGKSAEQNGNKISKGCDKGHKPDGTDQENDTNQNQRVYSLMQKFNGTNKVYVCSYCSKETKKPSDLVRHMRTHTKEKPFKCHCGCAFAYKDSLQAHMKKHLGKKCEKCSKVITSPKQWKAHLRKHTQEESTESNQIQVLKSSDTTVEDNINYHMRSNSEEKMCNTLSSNSTQTLQESESLYIRLDKTNNKSLLEHDYLVGPYECPYCKQKFRDFLMCRKHIDTHKTQEIQEIEVHESNVKEWQGNISISNLFEKQFEICQVVCDDQSNFQLNDDTEANSINNTVQVISQEKIASDSFTVLDSEQNQNIQTILVSYPEVQSGEFLSDFILTESDNGIILDTVNGQNRGSPIIFNVQTVNVSNEDIYVEEFPEKSADPVLSMTTQRNSPPLETLDNCGQIDLGDRFLSNNISLYPNQINVDPRSEINSETLTDNTNVNNTLQLHTTNESQENIGLSMIHCLVCKKMFESLEPYLTHIKTCGSTTAEKSEDETIKKCDNETTDSKKVKEKTTIIPARKYLNCVLCDKEFSNRGIYVKHINSHQKGGKEKWKCKFCKKEFKKISDLGRHLRTHTGEKPYACNQCDKKFTLKSTLEGHYRTHNPSAPKNFVCEVCNSFFTSKASRKLHMHVHTGSKPHKCTFCDQYFRTAAHRKCHELKIHLSYMKKKPKQTNAKKITNILAAAVDMAVNDIQNDNKVLEQCDPPVYPEIKVDFISSKCDTEAISIDPTLSQIQDSNILIQEVDQVLLPCSESDLASDTICMEGDNFSETHTVNNLFTVIEQEALKTTQFQLKKCPHCNLCFLSNEELSNHERSHQIGVAYMCFLCDRNLDGVQQLREHLESVHEIVDPTSQLIL